jgi:CPA2 family monovalent cation:H+ antiporter-2
VPVGPFTPGFVANRAVAEQLAEIGVILLLFGVGLRFHLRELLAVWRVAVPGALIQSTLSTLLLALLLRPFGWSWTSGLILGMGISVASTVVMALVLGERHDLHAPIGHIAIGWTVVEDLLTVALLLVLPILFGQGGAPGSTAAGAPAPRSAWPR